MSAAKPTSRWPSLFDGRASMNLHTNACVNYGTDPTPAYAEGYLRSARLLATHICETERDQDLLVYPILFALRHYLELSFKNMIWLARVYQKDRATWPMGSHKLASLWDDVRREYAQVYDRLPQDETGVAYLRRIDECVQAVAAVDPMGEDFRYGYRRDMTRTMGGKTIVSIEVLRGELDALDEAVGGLTFMLGQVADYACDARAEMRANAY
jgi:hypothetical protein